MVALRGKWYDGGNIDEMHEDLRTAYAATLPIVLERPALKRHFAGCVTCQAIQDLNQTAPANTTGIPHQDLLLRRKNFILDTADLTRLLDLPASAGILFISVVGYQDTLSITVCSPDYEPVLPGVAPLSVRVSLEGA